MKASQILKKLNAIGGANGIGIIDIVENRLIGMKDRGVYETPGGSILYFAHEQLEMLTVDKDTLHEKKKLAVDLADQIYNGKWYSALTNALVAFANESNKLVTGSVKLKLYKGNIIPPERQAPIRSTAKNWLPSARATMTRHRPRASSTSGACRRRLRRFANRGSCNLDANCRKGSD